MELNQSIDSYLAALGSDAPAPGGGAAAALTAAQSASLFAMVARLSKTDQVDWNAQAEEMDENASDFANLAKADAIAFTAVMKAYKLPKGEERTTGLQAALKAAATPPLQTIDLCWEMLRACRPYIEAANKNVVTDSGIAVSLARSAIESSMFNVLINLKFIKDEEFVASVRSKTDAITNDLDHLTKELITLVKSYL